MKKIYDIVAASPLFHGIDRADFEAMLPCMEARTGRYRRGGVVLLAGDPVPWVGLILSGGVHIVKEDREGNATIVTELHPPELFGETLACAGVAHAPVTVRAAVESEILFLNYKKILTTCPAACTFHGRLIENMLRLMAKKNLLLNQKLDILSKRTTRERLLLFFDAHRGDARAFTIPYNREALARYLCVDRSALSAELGKLRDEGVLRFRKNEFELL